MNSRLYSVGCIALLAAGACAGDGGQGETLELGNSGGKADAAEMRIRLSEANPLVGMGIECDGEQGCDGYLTVDVRRPDACTILDDPRCGLGRMEPKAVQIGWVTLRSETEGERTVPLEVRSDDGDYISSSVSLAFTGKSYEWLDIEVEHFDGAPEVTLSVRADWQDREAPGATELEEYLSGIEGMDYTEIATGYAGYRAYMLTYEQPLDHDNPDAGSFVQRAVLHHKDRAEPMVLYTSGYALFSEDYLSELADSMGANQLDTEQRFFGESYPDEMQLALWDHVTIRQAATDHHRFVEALRPFYDGSWLSTGHSKGGMTSVYHRRFYPNDVDLTVAYVAPISFAKADNRYVSFLDSIGTDECRQAFRAMQRELLERFAAIQPGVEQHALDAGYTFEEAGGHALAYEDGIETMEWVFWQYSGHGFCGSLPDQETLDAFTDQELLDATSEYLGVGNADMAPDVEFDGYYYQAARELGYPNLASAHLADLLQQPGTPWHLPEGTNPTYDPTAMQDIQQWVIDQGTQMIFLYGEYDPWTGGAFETPEDQGIIKVTVPQANHGAVIAGLADEDRESVLSFVEEWIGVRPPLTPAFTPSRAPLPPGLMRGGRPAL